MTHFEATPGGDDVTRHIRTILSTMDGTDPAPGQALPSAPPIDAHGLSRFSTATHPYRPAEGISGADIAYLYGSSPDMPPTKQVWKEVELALAGVASAKDALLQGDTILNQHSKEFYPDAAAPLPTSFSTEKDMKAWYGASMLRSFLPGFLSRIAENDIDAATAGRVYRAIVTDVMPAPLGSGMGSECAIAALGARAAANGSGTDRFLWLSSPREATSKLLAPDGSSLNHDFYRLAGVPRTKIPTEIKAHNQTTRHRYDDKITIVPAATILGGPVLGEAFTDANRRERPALMPALLRATHQLMRTEVESGQQSPELDAATAILYEYGALRQG
jgi:hypothetical protein